MTIVMHSRFAPSDPERVLNCPSAPRRALIPLDICQAIARERAIIAEYAGHPEIIEAARDRLTQLINESRQ